MIGRRSGDVPNRFEAPGKVTQRVFSSISAITFSGGSVPVAVSNGARTCWAPACSHARRHGEMLASWSNRVPTTRSPGRSVAPTARLNENVNVVMFGPKQMPAGSAPNSWPTTARVRDNRSAQSSVAVNGPPAAAVEPLAIQAETASIAVSTICVPAGASNRDQPLEMPGKR